MIVYQCYFLYFDAFWQFDIFSIKFEKLLIQIIKFFQNGVLYTKPCQFFVNSLNVTCQCSATINRKGNWHQIHLSLDILCDEKQVIWTWLIFLYSFDVFSKSQWHFLLMLLKILYLCNEKEPLPNVILIPYILRTLKNLKFKPKEITKQLTNCGFCNIYLQFHVVSKIKIELKNVQMRRPFCSWLHILSLRRLAIPLLT